MIRLLLLETDRPGLVATVVALLVVLVVLLLAGCAFNPPLSPDAHARGGVPLR